MPQHPLPASAHPSSFGPWVVRAAFVLAFFGWGVGFYGPPIYLAQVVARTGWPVSLVSAAVTVHFLCGVAVIACLNRLYARVGVAAVMGAGCVVAALGILGWSLAAQPWQLFAAALATGSGWVTLGAVAVNAVVSSWYSEGRPLALAKAYNGASVGGAVFAPLWVWLIARWGFTAAAAAVGAAMVLVIWMLAYGVFRRRPPGPAARAAGPEPSRHRDSGGAPALPARWGGPWRDRAFATLAAAMSLALFAQAGLLTHLYALLALTLGGQRAGWLVGAATACAILGRSLAARAVQRGADRRTVAAAGYALQALGSVALLCGYPDRLGLVVAGTLLFGSGIGNATSLPPAIAQGDFRPADVARVVALIVATSQATYAFAPALFGLLREGAAAGGGNRVLIAAIALHAVAALVLMAGRRRAVPAADAARTDMRG
jgi:MFS family permease